ncbi:MAG TPA: PDZ domain-containing protein [Malonomonas sp.]
MESGNSNSENHLCRACRQPLAEQATKCQHCGEAQVKTFSLEQQIKRVVGWIGFLTAFLSLFFMLKEGYYYIEQRQQQRELFAAHMRVAQQFLQRDNLEYAEVSLTKALKLNPGDKQLRLQYFLLRAQILLRDADATNPATELIPELVTDGFSLLENSFATTDQAQLLVSLARLLQYDQRWQNPTAITELFAKARQLAPGSAKVAYWSGEWLLSQQPPEPSGFKLIVAAAEKEPQNALYLYSLGYYQAKQGDYRGALDNFRQAIEVAPLQTEQLQRQAAINARYALRRALNDAAEQQEITGPEFFGMSLDERIAIIEFALELSGSDRPLLLLASRLFHQVGANQRAEELLRQRLGSYTERTDSELLELLLAILEAQQKSVEAQQVRDILASQQERATFEEILEAGLDGQHRYKVGLRLAKENPAGGVEVLKVYAGYPFAKAGLLPGDHLLEFAHREVINLRSVWAPITDFAPGTDVPLKILRDGQELMLTVVIE